MKWPCEESNGFKHDELVLVDRYVDSYESWPKFDRMTLGKISGSDTDKTSSSYWIRFEENRGMGPFMQGHYVKGCALAPIIEAGDEELQYILWHEHNWQHVISRFLCDQVDKSVLHMKHRGGHKTPLAIWDDGIVYAKVYDSDYMKHLGDQCKILTNGFQYVQVYGNVLHPPKRQEALLKAQQGWLVNCIAELDFRTS